MTALQDADPGRARSLTAAESLCYTELVLLNSCSASLNVCSASQEKPCRQTWSRASRRRQRWLRGAEPAGARPGEATTRALKPAAHGQQNRTSDGARLCRSAIG